MNTTSISSQLPLEAVLVVLMILGSMISPGLFADTMDFPTNDGFEALTDQALELRVEGRFTEACELFHRAWQELGETPDGNFLRLYAETLFWADRWEAALEPVEAELAVRPDSAWALAFKGQILSWKYRWEQAEDLFREALRQNPDERAAVLGLAELFEWTDRPVEAIDLLDTYLGNHPDQPEALSLRKQIGRNRSIIAGFDGDHLADNREATIGRYSLSGRVPLGRRDLTLHAAGGWYSIDEDVRPTDIVPIERTLDGWTGKLSLRWRHAGRFELSAGPSIFAVGDESVTGGHLSFGWNPVPSWKSTITAAIRREAESYDVPALLDGIYRDDISLMVESSKIPRTLVHLAVSSLDFSDSNSGSRQSGWFLTDLLKKDGLSLAVGYGYSKYDIDEYRYQLRGYTSEWNPTTGAYTYELDGEFTYWSPSAFEQHRALLSLNWAISPRADLSLSGGYSFSDSARLPFLYAEDGMTPAPEFENIIFGDYKVTNDHPYEIHAGLQIELPAELGLKLGYHRVDSIFYDYDSITLSMVKYFLPGSSGNE